MLDDVLVLYDDSIFCRLTEQFGDSLVLEDNDVYAREAHPQHQQQLPIITSSQFW